jgi:uncharacterized protein (TIGR00255 family)
VVRHAKEIHSMTGYGRATADGKGFRATVDIRTVNGRFLEIRPKLPRTIGFVEPNIRELVQKYLKRGVIDLSLSLQTEGTVKERIDEEAVAAYVDAIEKCAKDLEIPTGLSIVSLLRLPGTVVGEEMDFEVDEEEVSRITEVAVTQALKELVEMREKEGAKLIEFIFRELKIIDEKQKEILSRSKKVNAEFRKKMLDRIEQFELTPKFDEHRLMQEVAFYLDRSDVVEEIDRLHSHVKQMHDLLAKPDGPVGKKLDFILQETGREVNTIGSKSDDIHLSSLVVDLKVSLERIREQVQNLE